MNENKAPQEYKYVLIQEKRSSRGIAICIISGQWVMQNDKKFYWPSGKSETVALDMAIDGEEYDSETWDIYDYDKILFKTSLFHKYPILHSILIQIFKAFYFSFPHRYTGRSQEEGNYGVRLL